MENEDIVQSPDDSLNQSIQEQAINSNVLPVAESIDTVEFKSPEQIKSYVPKKPILEFEDIKEFIKSYLNPSETEQEKEKKYSAFNLNKTKAIIEENKSADLFDKLDKFDVNNPNLGVFNRDLSYFYIQKLAEKEAADKASKNPNIVKIDNRTYIDTETGKNIYSSVVPEIVEDALYGLQRSGYGFAQILAGLVDYGFDTKTLSAVDEVYEKYKFEKPDTLIGEIVSTLTEYAVPITIVNKLSFPLRQYLKYRLKENLSPYENLSSVRLAEKGIDYIGSGVALGIADFINAGPGRETIYETITGEKRLESEEGLSGKELAAARFRNKIRFGQEGVALGAVGHAVGNALPTGLKYGLVKPLVGTYNIGSKLANAVVYNPIASILSKSDVVVPAISKAIREGSQSTKQAILEPFIRGYGKIEYVNGLPVYTPKYLGKIPPYEEWKLFQVTDADPFKVRLKNLDNYIRYFTESFNKPYSAYDLTERAFRNLKGQSKAITKYLDDLEVRSYNLAKSFGEQYKNNPSSQGSREYYLNLVEEFIKNQRKLNSLPKELQPTALALKEHFNNVKKTFVDLLPEGDLKDEFSKIIKNYMKKSFAIFTNTEYQPPKEILENAIKEGISIVKKNKDMVIEAKKQFPGIPIMNSIKNYSEALIKDIINTAKSDTADPLLTLQKIGKEKLKLSKSILSGDELPVTIRKLLGEEKNLRSSLLQTTSSFLTQTINKKLYDDIAEIGLKAGWLKSSKGVNQNLQQINNIPGLGLMDSKISKLYAPSDIALSFKNGYLDSWINADWYRSLMQLKTGIQFGKTVLAPESQIKNFITNAGFPISYGWVGGKTSLTDSIKIIVGDIYGAGKDFNTPFFIKNIEKLVKLKVLDDNIVVSELSAIMKQLQEGGFKNSTSLFKKINNSKLIETSSKFYQGGDNIWRLLGYEWNNTYLTKAFKGDLSKLIREQELITGEKYIPISNITGKTKTFSDAVDEFSAWYVRKLMPTYSELPEFIKNLRKAPVGNFISWPAAIIKISGEGIRTALRETSSSMPEMRQLGIRKLIGLSTTYGGAGYVINGIAQNLTGVTEEQIEAYKRSFAPDYNKNSSISPYSPIKDNMLKIINFSYGDVYDTIKKPVRAALTELDKIKKPEDIDNFVFKAILSATSELVKPYISEPLGANTLLEVLPKSLPFAKGGIRKDGTRIYSDSDSWGDALEKSIIHVLYSAAPGFVNTAVKYGEAVYDLFTGRSRPDDLRNKFISTLSGTKVENIDLQKTFESKIIKFAPNVKSELFATEGFYSTQDWQSRKPEKMSKEFENIQKEGFEQQKQLRQIVKDARTLNIPDTTILKILNEKIKDKELVANIMFTNKFTPVDFSEKALFDRYLKIKREESIANREPPSVREVYPISDLVKVKSKHYGLSLDDTYENAILKKYKEEEEKSIQPGRNELFPKIPLRQDINTQSNIQTPPLPTTPQPVAAANITSQINPTTKLTSVESALLSPTEQAIRQTQRA